MMFSQPSPFPGLMPEPVSALDIGIHGFVDLRYAEKISSLHLIQDSSLENRVLNADIDNDYLAQYFTDTSINTYESIKRHAGPQVSYLKHSESDAYFPSDMPLRALHDEIRRNNKRHLHNRHLRGNALHTFSYEGVCYFFTLSGPNLNRLELYQFQDKAGDKVRLVERLELGRSATGFTIAKESYMKSEKVIVAVIAAADVILVDCRPWLVDQQMSLKSAIRVQHSIISSVRLNPYAGAPLGSLCPYDCVIATLDGAVWAWEGYASSRLRLLKAPDEQKDESEVTSVPVICWGAHPRKILFANGPNLYEIDFRTSASMMQPLWSSTEDGGAPTESVLTLERLQESPERFHYIFATGHHFFLIDLRYPKRPLLKWRHRLSSVAHGIMRCLHVKDGQYFVFLSSTHQVDAPASTYVWQFELDPSATAPIDEVESEIDAIAENLIQDDDGNHSSNEDGISLEFKQPSKSLSFGPLCPRLASLPQKIPIFVIMTQAIPALRVFDRQTFGLAVFVNDYQATRATSKADESEDDDSESSSSSADNHKNTRKHPMLHVLHSSAACDVFHQRFSISSELAPTETPSGPSAPFVEKLEKRTLDPPTSGVKGTREFKTVDLSRVVNYMIKHRVLPDKEDEAPKELPSTLKNIRRAILCNALKIILKYLRHGKNKHDITGDLPPRTLHEITAHLASLYPGYRFSSQTIESLLSEFNRDPEKLLGDKADDFDEDDRFFSLRLQHGSAGAPSYTATAEVLYSVSPIVNLMDGEEERAPGEADAEIDASQVSDGGGGFDRTITSVLASQTQASFLSQGQQGILADLLKKFKKSTQGGSADSDDEADENGERKRRKDLLARMKSAWESNRPEVAIEEEIERPPARSATPTPVAPRAAAPAVTPVGRKASPSKTISSSTRHLSSTITTPSVSTSTGPSRRKLAASSSSVVLSPPASQMAFNNDDNGVDDDYEDSHFAPATQNTQPATAPPPAPMFSSPAAASWLNKSGGIGGGFGTPAAGDQQSSYYPMGFGTPSFGSPPASQQPQSQQPQSQQSVFFGGFGSFGSPSPFGASSQPFGTPQPFGSQNTK